MNEIPPEEMSNEGYNQLFEDDEFAEDYQFDLKINQFLENLTSEQRESIPELQALFTLFVIKEYKFEDSLKMVRETRKNFSIDANYFADWRSRVQVKLRETSDEELGIDDSQRRQIERVLLGLDK